MNYLRLWIKGLQSFNYEDTRRKHEVNSFESRFAFIQFEKSPHWSEFHNSALYKPARVHRRCANSNIHKNTPPDFPPKDLILHQTAEVHSNCGGRDN